jgi:hypothetical protein
MALYIALEGLHPRYGRQPKDGLVRAVRAGDDAKWELAHVSVRRPREKLTLTLTLSLTLTLIP